jgi:hypothetical protein
MVQEVGSMEARLEKASEGLPGAQVSEKPTSLTGGVPKPVKKTFAEKMSGAELSQRLKGAAVGGVNVPGAPATTRRAAQPGATSQPAVSLQQAKPGAIDPYKEMLRDLNG